MLKVVLRILVPFVTGLAVYFIPSVPHVVRNYVPDFLWAFSFTSSLILIWGRLNRGWIITLLLLFIVFELFQKWNIIAGTFDFLDIVLYFAASLSSIIIFKLYEKN